MVALRWGTGISLALSAALLLFGIFVLVAHRLSLPASAGDMRPIGLLVSGFLMTYGTVSGVGLWLCLKGSPLGALLLALPVLLVAVWTFQSSPAIGEMLPIVLKIGVDVAIAIGTLALRR